MSVRYGNSILQRIRAQLSALITILKLNWESEYGAEYQPVVYESTVAGNVDTVISNDEPNYILRLRSGVLELDTDATAANRRFLVILRDRDDNHFFTSQSPVIVANEVIKIGMSPGIGHWDDLTSSLFGVVPLLPRMELKYGESLLIRITNGVAGDSYSHATSWEKLKKRTV
jgi:hypothetical protein